jgi:predicted transcriptional regulator
MELTPYIDELQRHLALAAEAGGDDARVIAERLAAPLEAATRLVLLEALSAAAGEITRDIAPGSVDVRLRGRDPEFVVARAASDEFAEAEAHAPVPPTPAPVDLDEGSTSRTTLRLPDALKARVDDAAAADGLSVNTWLVRAVAAALEPKQRRTAQRTLRSGDSFAGWAH